MRRGRFLSQHSGTNLAVTVADYYAVNYMRHAHVSDRDVEAAAECIGGVMAGIMDRSPARSEATP